MAPTRHSISRFRRFRRLLCAATLASLLLALSSSSAVAGDETPRNDQQRHLRVVSDDRTQDEQPEGIAALRRLAARYEAEQDAETVAQLGEEIRAHVDRIAQDLAGRVVPGQAHRPLLPREWADLRDQHVREFDEALLEGEGDVELLERLARNDHELQKQMRLIPADGVHRDLVEMLTTWEFSRDIGRLRYVDELPAQLTDASERRAVVAERLSAADYARWLWLELLRARLLHRPEAELAAMEEELTDARTAADQPSTRAGEGLRAPPGHLSLVTDPHADPEAAAREQELRRQSRSRHPSSALRPLATRGPGASTVEGTVGAPVSDEYAIQVAHLQVELEDWAAQHAGWRNTFEVLTADQLREYTEWQSAFLLWMDLVDSTERAAIEWPPGAKTEVDRVIAAAAALQDDVIAHDPGAVRRALVDQEFADWTEARRILTDLLPQAPAGSYREGAERQLAEWEADQKRLEALPDPTADPKFEDWHVGLLIVKVLHWPTREGWDEAMAELEELTMRRWRGDDDWLPDRDYVAELLASRGDSVEQDVPLSADVEPVESPVTPVAPEELQVLPAAVEPTELEVAESVAGQRTEQIDDQEPIASGQDQPALETDQATPAVVVPEHGTPPAVGPGSETDGSATGCASGDSTTSTSSLGCLPTSLTDPPVTDLDNGLPVQGGADGCVDVPGELRPEGETPGCEQRPIHDAAVEVLPVPVIEESSQPDVRPFMTFGGRAQISGPADNAVPDQEPDAPIAGHSPQIFNSVGGVRILGGLD